MSTGSDAADPTGLLLVAPPPAELQSGGPWVLIADWAEAGAQLLGEGVITTPQGTMTAAQAHALATRSSRGPLDVSPWRRRVPDVVATAVKDARAALRAGRRRSSAELERVRAGGLRTPFVWQYHWLFDKRGRQLADALGVPLVIAVDALQVWEARQWGVERPGWGGPLERVGELRQLRRADLVTCISTKVRDELVARDIPAERILVTPNVADPARFEGADRQRFRATWDIGDRIAVGWVGSFRRFHALESLFDAFALLANRRDDVVLVLVGDGPERRSCEAWADALGRDSSGRSRVVLASSIPYDAIPDAVAAFDIGTVTARPDQEFHYSPLKLQEYLAAGLPTVAPEIGQIAASLTDVQQVLLYEPGDTDALARALERLVDDPALRSELGRRGRDHQRGLGGTGAQLRRVIDALSALPRR